MNEFLKYIINIIGKISQFIPSEAVTLKEKLNTESKIGLGKLELQDIKKKTTESLQEMGSIIYNFYKNKPAGKRGELKYLNKINPIIKKIKSLEKETKKIEKELTTIREKSKKKKAKSKSPNGNKSTGKE